jgi:hypothetical protein
MADFISLSCPHCGAQLQVTPDLERFACGHCGQEQIVKRAGGIVSLALVNAVDKVTTAVDKVAAGTDRSAAAAAIPVLEQTINAEIARLLASYAPNSPAYNKAFSDLYAEAHGTKKIPRGLFGGSSYKHYVAEVGKLAEMYAKLKHYKEIVLG